MQPKVQNSIRTTRPRRSFSLSGSEFIHSPVANSGAVAVSELCIQRSCQTNCVLASSHPWRSSTPLQRERRQQSQSTCFVVGPLITIELEPASATPLRTLTSVEQTVSLFWQPYRQISLATPA